MTLADVQTVLRRKSVASTQIYRRVQLDELIARGFPIALELAHGFAQLIQRVRGEHATIPLCPRYDTRERTWGPPLPHLFRHPAGGAHQVRSPASVRNWFRGPRPLEPADLHDVDGSVITFRPHGLRGLFATEVVSTGLPIHIAAAVLGHRMLDTTRGYTAVYPDDVIRHYQTLIHERRTPAAAGRVPETARRRMESSSGTSPCAGSPTATATGPTAPAASTNTRAFGAICSGRSTARCRCCARWKSI